MIRRIQEPIIPEKESPTKRPPPPIPPVATEPEPEVFTSPTKKSESLDASKDQIESVPVSGPLIEKDNFSDFSDDSDDLLNQDVSCLRNLKNCFFIFFISGHCRTH